MKNRLQGQAYAFFDCDASKEIIESKMPILRRESQTPSDLELSLTDDLDSLKEDDLLSIVQEAKDSGMNYLLKATYPNATNKKTADELATMINMMYASPLYKPGEEFSGAIVYKEKDKYVFRD